MIDALRRASAERVTAVIPYYGYAKQEKKTAGREPISAKLVANLIRTAGVDRVLTIDLHAPAIEGFFDIPVDHLRADPAAGRCVLRERLGDDKDLVVVSPDAVASAARTTSACASARAPGDHRQAAPPAGHGRGDRDGRRRARARRPSSWTT